MTSPFSGIAAAPIGIKSSGRSMEIRTTDKKLMQTVLTPYEPEPPQNVAEYALATGQAAVHRLRILDQVYGAGTREVLREAPEHAVHGHQPVGLADVADARPFGVPAVRAVVAVARLRQTEGLPFAAIE